MADNTATGASTGDTGSTDGQAPQTGSTQQTPAQGQPQPPATGEGQPTGEPDWSSLGDFDDVKDALANARKWEKRAKDNKGKADQYDKLHSERQSETEKATARADGAEKSLAAFKARAVAAEIKAQAAKDFADPEDAAAFLDADAYLTEHDDIDTKRIGKDLADLLKRKPHLAVDTQSKAGGNGASQSGYPSDPGQGAPGTGSLDDELAQAQASGDVRRSLALKSQRLLQAQQRSR